jgi:hypothetical protein
MSDIELRKDRDLTLVIPVYNDDGTPADLTGASAKWWMAIRIGETAGEVVVEKDDVVISSDTIGGVEVPTLIVMITPADTADLDHMHLYKHEAAVMLSGGGTFTVAEGIVKLLPFLIPA